MKTAINVHGVQPTEWHRWPQAFRMRCPICGCPTGHQASSLDHRAVDPSEGLAAAYIARLRHRTTGDWVYKTIVTRKAKPPRITRWPTPRPRMDALATDATMPLRLLLEKGVVADWLAGRSESTLVNYRATVNAFARFLKHDPLVSDLRADVFLPFFVFCLQSGRYRRTVVRSREHLLLLWKYAAAVGITPEPPEIAAVPDAAVPMELTDEPAPPDTLRHCYETIVKPRVLARAKPSWTIQNDAAVRKFYLFCAGDIAVNAVTDARLAEFQKWMTTARGHTSDLAEKYTACIRRILREWNPAEFPRPQNRAWNKIDEIETAEMSVRWYFNEHYLPAHALRKTTEDWYRLMLRKLDRWLGRDAMLADFNRDTVNKYLMAMQAIRSAAVVHAMRRTMLTIWRAAYDDDLIEYAPRSIRKIKAPYPTPDAWSPEEMERLVFAARHSQFDRRTKSGMRIGDYLESLIRVGYDTALRLGDLETLSWRGVRPDGTVIVRMAKTGNIKTGCIHPATLACIQRIRQPGDDRVLPWSAGRRRFYIWWRILLTAAGLEVCRRNGPQKLRRTSATLVEMANVGMATGHLGHRSGDLARRHYIDAGMAYKPTMPPAIPEPPKLLEGPTEHVA